MGTVGLLTDVRLGDLEGWEGKPTVRLAPLTLFFGRNGSGKSTLIRALRDKAAAAKPGPRPSGGRLRRGDRELEELLGYWLTTMGVIDDFSIVESLEDAGVYSLRIKAKGSEAHVPVTRAGSGAPRALLTLVPAFSRATPVHVDHPESHLHPSAQSALGDALLDAVRTRGTQLLVETHSERLLRRIQRRVAEGQVTRDDVAAYLIEECDGESEIRELALDEDGGIANWPARFFGSELDDVIAMTMAAAKRHGRADEV